MVSAHPSLSLLYSVLIPQSTMQMPVHVLCKTSPKCPHNQPASQPGKSPAQETTAKAYLGSFLCRSAPRAHGGCAAPCCGTGRHHPSLDPRTFFPPVQSWPRILYSKQPLWWYYDAAHWQPCMCVCVCVCVCIWRQKIQRIKSESRGTPAQTNREANENKNRDEAGWRWSSDNAT